MLPTDKNIVLGSGHVYFDIFDAAGDTTGELYIAETPGFELTIASESIEVDSSDGPVAELLADIATKVTRTATVIVKSISVDVLALFVMGDIKTETPVSAGTGLINGGKGVEQGLWYQIGQTSALPSGEKNIVLTKIEDPSGLVDDDLYISDPSAGRIYIKPMASGGITKGTVLTADFVASVKSWESISSNNLGAKTGAFRFIADNTFGENRDLYFPKTSFKPSGTLPFKSRDTVQEMTFDISILIPDNGSSVYINGRPA